MAVRVLIVDEHAVLRSGLRMLLESQPDMTVVGEAGDGETALAVARDAAPDVITLDPAWGDGDCLEIIRTLRRECPEVRILIVTMHDDPGFFGEVMLAGGSGYVLKRAGETEVLAAVRAVSQGRVFVSLTLTEDFVKAVAEGPGRLRPKAWVHADLSQREAEVLSLVAQGYTSQQIAGSLFLSTKTIETYRSRLSKKLGLKDRADLVRFATQAGLLDSSRLTDTAHDTLMRQHVTRAAPETFPN